MDKNEKRNREYYTIDVMHILRSIWYKAWVVILVAILAASVGFGYSAFVIEPDYSSSILLYVNNSSINLGNTSFNISSADLNAAERLVKTYIELLKNRTTLERVAAESGLPYSAGELYGMISAGASNETEIMRVTVVAKSPNDAAKIANTIAEVLPDRVSEIIDGASMEVVDSAIPNQNKIAPNVTRYTATYMIVGALAAAVIIAVIAVADDTIHDEDYVLTTYDYPVLAKVPDLLGAGVRGYGNYYYKYSKPNEEVKSTKIDI